MKMYDSLSRTVKPLPDGRPITFYACGVTVYDYCHIGHARSYVVWDVLKRWKIRESKFVHVQNFTDVDDKIIERARVERVSPAEIAERYIAAYHEDMDWLNIRRADDYPRVTPLMDAMRVAARWFVEKGYAYERDGDIRFQCGKHPGYGKMSGRPVEPDQEFVLWKGPKAEEPEFPKGRPGWHLECSIMIERCFDFSTIDIHAGGNDLLFPHHENEIAQSECLHDGAPLANHWLHNGMVHVDDKKMGKSEGNAFQIRWYRQSGVDPNLIRYWILGVNYRKPLSKSGLDDGTVALQWATLQERLRNAPAKGVTEGFAAALNDDLNTASALAELLRSPTLEMAEILGFRIQAAVIPEEVMEMAQRRELLRQNGYWTPADEARKTIDKMGYEVRDNPGGGFTVVKK